ncbi:MAG: methyltransferase domain-containing protein [Nitrospinae bacterium]|nr:methyltransferase domain-containing protein [Nitrospinota bacterium]
MMTFRQIVETIDRLEEAHVLLAALELKIFTALEKKQLTSEEVARAAKTHAPATETLLDALSAMGALRKRGKKFANTPETYKHLCETSKDYKKGIVMLRKENRKEWEHLLGAVRDGRDLSQYQGPDDPEFRWLFTHAMHERSDRFAPKIAAITARKRVGRLLDLGGGPGSYSAAILKKDKKATAVLLDRPATLEVSREILRGMKLLGRFQFIEGDMFQVPFGEDYDTVLFSNVLHIYDEDQNKTLFEKINRSLNKGGRVIVVDFFLDDSRTKPYEAALFGVTMLLYTATGKTYTFKETEALLRDTGFKSLQRFPLGNGAALIQAAKK